MCHRQSALLLALWPLIAHCPARDRCSIQQGGVASRPGHEYDAFLSRELNREVFNFGFAGNGVEELSVAQVCWFGAAGVPKGCLPPWPLSTPAHLSLLAPPTQFITTLDAHLIVIDCLPNMNAAEVGERTIPLVQYFRQRHPSTPIVLAEGTPSAPYHLFASDQTALLEKNAALKSCFEKLVKDGDTNLYYVESKSIVSQSEGGGASVFGGSFPAVCRRTPSLAAPAPPRVSLSHRPTPAAPLQLPREIRGEDDALGFEGPGQPGGTD